MGRCIDIHAHSRPGVHSLGADHTICTSIILHPISRNEGHTPGALPCTHTCTALDPTSANPCNLDPVGILHTGKYLGSCPCLAGTATFPHTHTRKLLDSAWKEKDNQRVVSHIYISNFPHHTRNWDHSSMRHNHKYKNKCPHPRTGSHHIPPQFYTHTRKCLHSRIDNLGNFAPHTCTSRVEGSKTEVEGKFCCADTYKHKHEGSIQGGAHIFRWIHTHTYKFYRLKSDWVDISLPHTCTSKAKDAKSKGEDKND